MASRVSPHPPDLISISTRFESKSAACLALALASHELSHFSENFGENDLVRGALPNDSSLVDLGQHRLRDVAEMEHVFQLEHRSCAPIFHHLPRPLKAGSANQVYLRPYI